MFFSLVVAVFATVDSLITFGLRRVDTAEFGAMNGIVSGRINATVLISGSSRALNHYDPREITRRTGVAAWNIGVNGAQTDMQLAVLETYLRHNTPPALPKQRTRGLLILSCGLTLHSCAHQALVYHLADSIFRRNCLMATRSRGSSLKYPFINLFFSLSGCCR